MCKIKPCGRRRTCFAAPGGMIHRKHYNRGNTQYMIDFVRSIREKYGKALPVVGNTSYHKYGALMGTIETHGGGDMRLEYLAAYSPDLNPVEMVGQYIKKYVSNGICPLVNDMTKAMDGMIRDGAVVPQSLPGYAMRVIKSAAAA